jgi:hypothetical protein
LLKDCPDLWDDFLADFLAGFGTGVAIIFFTTSSNLTPWSLKSFAFAMLELKHKSPASQGLTGWPYLRMIGRHG